MKSLISILLITWSASFANAQGLGANEDLCNMAKTESARLQQMLKEQRLVLTLLEDSVQREKLARLLLIKDDVQKIETEIRANVAAGKASITIQTLYMIQHLIIKYRFSKVFFGWEDKPSYESILTEETAGVIKRLRRSSEDMVRVFGFDNSPYTTITSTTFSEMEKLIRQLQALPLDGNLKKSLQALLPEIGRTIAVASQGDRPCAFYAAGKVVRKVQALYPEFNDFAMTSTGYSLIMSLQGLTEFYAEFSQADQQTAVGVCKGSRE